MNEHSGIEGERPDDYVVAASVFPNIADAMLADQPPGLTPIGAPEAIAALVGHEDGRMFTMIRLWTQTYHRSGRTFVVARAANRLFPDTEIGDSDLPLGLVPYQKGATFRDWVDEEDAAMTGFQKFLLRAGDGQLQRF